jgi:hypothetical protein
MRCGGRTEIGTPIGNAIVACARTQSATSQNRSVSPTPQDAASSRGWTIASFSSESRLWLTHRSGDNKQRCLTRRSGGCSRSAETLRRSCRVA